MDIYNRRLDERERRRQLLIDWGLLNTKRLQAIERRRPAAEHAMHAALRPFARYLADGPAAQAGADAALSSTSGLGGPFPALEQLVDGLLVEQQLRGRIAGLQHYRSLGIRSLHEAEEFEAARARRQPATMPSSSSAAASAAAAGVQLGGTTRTVRAAGKAMSVVLEDLATLRGSNPLGPVPLDAPGKRELQNLLAAQEAAGEGPRAGALPQWRSEQGANLLRVSGLPGGSLLEEAETGVCGALRLTPPHLEALKDQAARHLGGSASLLLDPARLDKIRDVVQP